MTSVESTMSALLDRLRFATAVLRPSQGLLAFDREQRYLYWSGMMETIFGLSAGDVIGMPARHVLPFLARANDRDLLPMVLTGHSAESARQPFYVPETGRKGHFEASYRPLFSDDGTVVGATAIIQEVTERVRVEEKLRETENRFRNMADASPVLLWMSGTDTLCTFFNKTWLEFTGRTMEQELGAGWAEGLHTDDAEQCLRTYLSAFEARTEFEMVYRLRRADGQYRAVLDRGAPRYEPDGTFAGYIGSCVDITKHRDLELSLRRALQDREDFLTIASHELKTPLTTLQLAVEILLRSSQKSSLPVPAQFTKYLEKIDGQACRLTLLVDDLLDVSRLSAGILDLTLEDVDLGQLVRDVLARLADPIRTSGCVVTVDVCDVVAGRWDRDRVERIVTNLVSNALKYASAKPVTITVRQHEDVAHLVVRDEGIGISEEHQGRIFERFERVVSPRHFGGFGLGLWITRQLVEGHRGKIRVTSTLGEGATFEVALPVLP